MPNKILISAPWLFRRVKVSRMFGGLARNTGVALNYLPPEFVNLFTHFYAIKIKFFKYKESGVLTRIQILIPCINAYILKIGFSILSRLNFNYS